MNDTIEIRVSISRRVGKGPVTDVLSSSRTDVQESALTLMEIHDFMALAAGVASDAFKNLDLGHRCEKCGHILESVPTWSPSSLMALATQTSVRFPPFAVPSSADGSDPKPE
jgi:hypothetical protein